MPENTIKTRGFVTTTPLPDPDHPNWNSLTDEEWRANFDAIHPGDSVTVSSKRGGDVQTRKGRVTIKNHRALCLVLNAGGRHGTPVVCDKTNFVSFKAARKPGSA